MENVVTNFIENSIFLRLFWPDSRKMQYSKACYCTIFGPRKTPCSAKSCYIRLRLLSGVNIVQKERVIEALACKESEPCYSI